MSPTSTHRPLTKHGDTKQKRLVRYYVSQQALKHGFKTCPIKSVNAEHLDDLIRAVVLDHLAHQPLGDQLAEARDHWLRHIIDGVVLSTSKVTIELNTERVRELYERDLEALRSDPLPRPTCAYRPSIDDRGRTIRLTLDISIKRRDGRRLILTPEGKDLVLPSIPEPKQHLVDAIGLAYRWHDQLVKSGLTIRAFAAANGIARSRLLKLLPLTQLGPVALKHTLCGTLPPSTTLDDLVRAAAELDWSAQADQLGVDAVGA